MSNNQKLFDNLKAYGIRGVVIKVYLNNRQQCVYHNNKYSNVLLMWRRVSQVSILRSFQHYHNNNNAWLMWYKWSSLKWTKRWK